MPKLPQGLYDQVLTEHLADLIEEAEARLGSVDQAEAPYRFSQHIGDLVARALEGRELDTQLDLANQIVTLLGEGGERIAAPPRALRAVGSTDTPPQTIEPDIGLSAHDLLVNARGEPQLAPELRKELASADSVDLIVAFVRWYGVRLLLEPLEDAVCRGASIRLLTTTYTGSTERRALDELRERGVDVRVSYDTETTRLHAKAWIFHRDTGFSTAYVGSSNLTKTALLDGREWNVRLSKALAPKLFEKIVGAFQSQWESGDYEPYDPGRDSDRLDTALQQGAGPSGDLESPLSGLELRPWPYQAEILEALDVDRRVHDRWRSLVVAPTGTGKTVVAALDYKRLREERLGLSLLFIAHREQILVQARRTFREALGSGSFGEMLVGGQRPENYQHVFASIQSLHQLDVGSIDPSAFDMVIVDEFHHAEAASYQRWLDHLEPQILLALTATPERTDGLDVRKWTHGHTAFDMRLWHALDRGLVAPFQYFGVADVADLSQVGWSRGQYNANDLTAVYTGTDARAHLIAREVRRIVSDPGAMRALAFCATVEHADSMAAAFNRVGWRSVSLSADTPQNVREEHIAALRAGDLTTIFTRDVFNEGVDIPEVDTILLLRPTESVTVYLQQIGRGLRRHATKEVCTILDFVAQYRREYRFDLRLRALTGITRRELVDAAEADFPFLPSGCHIHLDRQAREWVLESIKAAVQLNVQVLGRELSVLASQMPDGQPVTLRRFLEETGTELQDVARVGGWTRLRRRANLEGREASSDESRLQKGATRLIHADDLERIDRWSGWLHADQPPELGADRERRLASMLLCTAWGLRNVPESFEAAWAGIREAAPIREEILAVLEVLRDRIPRVGAPIDLPDVPLRFGATYSRDEILAAFGKLYPGGAAYSHQAGPWHHAETNSEVLFITLSKSLEQYSPETMYRDYAISRELFHWDTPNDTRIDSLRGHRYLEQRTNGLSVYLAVRETKKDPWGATAPYVLLGPADYISHQGQQPIGITWRLRNPIPADLFEQFKLAVA